MFHVPSDAIADPCFSLNLIQLDHPNASLPSPENSPSSSPASLSCSSISSLKAWRSASEQLQAPIFSFPHPVYHNIAAVTAHSSDEFRGQHNSCIPMSAFDVPSSQEPTIPSVDEDELVDLHWTTGVPCHMMDVFRANPFAAVDPPRTTTTTPTSLDNSTDHSSQGLHCARSATKHILSPDAVEQKRKTRTKRARTQPPSAIPFPSTGPQEMFAYEFRLEIPYRSTSFSPDEDHRRCGDSHPSYSLARAMDARENLRIPRPVAAFGSEDASMRSPLEHEDMKLSLPLRLPYPCSRTTSKSSSEYHMQPSHYPFSPVLSTHTSLLLQEPSNLATYTPRQGIDEYWSQFDEHGCNSQPPAVPMQFMPERTSPYRPSSVPAALLIQKSLYACPLCPRDFQLPNGLALHLKWHDRVGNLTRNQTPYLSRRPQEQETPKHPHTELGQLDAREVRFTQLPAQDDGQRGAISVLPSIPYTVPQEANSAQAESVSKPLEYGLMFVAMADKLFEIISSDHELYTTSAVSYERQPQECALFHDVLQLTQTVNNNPYLAPLDGLSVLQPLPFERCHSTTGQLCAQSPP